MTKSTCVLGLLAATACLVLAVACETAEGRAEDSRDGIGGETAADSGPEAFPDAREEAAAESAAEVAAEIAPEVTAEVTAEVGPEPVGETLEEVAADTAEETLDTSETSVQCCVYDHDCPVGFDCAKPRDAWTGACLALPGGDGCWEDDTCGPGRLCLGAFPCPCDGEAPEGCGAPGTCHDELPGCCGSDLDCPAPLVCAPGNTCAEPLVFGRCWSDADCHPSQACAGTTVCPCGEVCSAPTAAGQCVPLPQGCCYTDQDCDLGQVCRGRAPWTENLPGSCVPSHVGPACLGDAACCWEDGDCPGGWCQGAGVCPCVDLMSGDVDCLADSMGFCQGWGLVVDQVAAESHCEAGSGTFADLSWLAVTLTWHTSAPATSHLEIALNAFTGQEGITGVGEQPTEEHTFELLLTHFTFPAIPRAGDVILVRVRAETPGGAEGLSATYSLPVDQSMQDCLYPFDATCSDGGPVLCRAVPPPCDDDKVTASIDGCQRCVFPATCTCDDGQPAVCASVPPSCGAGEVLAVQEGCFVCAAAQSCRPVQPVVPTALTLDPASLLFGSLPIGSYRPMISGYDPVARTCVSLIWYYDSPWSGGFCDAFPDFMAYAIITPDTDGPCGQWEYGGDWTITTLDGCADWAEFGAGHLDLADFTATLTAYETGLDAPTFSVTVDNRSETTPPLLTLGLSYSTDIPEDVWIQSGDAYGLPDWVHVSRDGQRLVLFDRCDLPVCGEGGGVCGQAFQTVTNLTNTSYGGDAYLTWDGLMRVEDPENGCWKREVAPPGEYEVEACFAWAAEETDVGTVVKDPFCVKQTFSLPADAWIVVASMGG